MLTTADAMKSEDRAILDDLAARVRERFPSAHIWAFGSRARGEASADSDLDVCVVLDHLDRASEWALTDIACDVGYDHELLITIVRYSREELEEGPWAASPLVRTIRREGVAA